MPSMPSLLSLLSLLSASFYHHPHHAHHSHPSRHAHRQALNATSVVVLCDWPLVGMMLFLAKQLFLLEQRQRYPIAT